MYEVLVGPLTLVVDHRESVDLLQRMQAARLRGDTEAANKLWKIVARVEAGTLDPADALKEAAPLSRAA